MATSAQAIPFSHLQTKSYGLTSDLRKGLESLPQGTICEVLGDSSTGRTAVSHAMLATATRGGGVVAMVDSDDAFDPATAQRAGADLGKLLWVQCGHSAERALRAADMILHSGGFGLIVLDLCDASPAALNRVPISYWHRYRLAVERTPSILLVLARQSVARSCATRQFELRQTEVQWRGAPPFQTMDRLSLSAVSRKPMGMEPVSLEALAGA